MFICDEVKNNYKDSIKNILSEPNINNLVFNDNNIFDPFINIKSSDLILGIHSSMLDDAFFGGKPIIIFDYFKIHYNIFNFGNELYSFNERVD